MRNSFLASLTVLAVALGCVLDDPVADHKVRTDEPMLEYGRLVIERTSDRYVEVRGEVVNVSSMKLDSVWVDVNIYDKNGEFVTTEDTTINYRPLMPGQRSPFKVMIQYNPVFERYSVRFRTIRGVEIPSASAPAEVENTEK